ncbi:MAG: hypothetical protein EOO85_02515 [Pedobacter sp.]|nr:MAG: hypothetical protein EOO85_02515 [Pedobacter sp.]
MRYWSVVVPGLPAQAMALYPFMLFKNSKLKLDNRLIRHEQIHFKQQLELLIVFFYILYLLNYLINLVRFRKHDKAYFQICFEKEAYQNDHDLEYMKNRKLFSWIKLI